MSSVSQSPSLPPSLPYSLPPSLPPSPLQRGRVVRTEGVQFPNLPVGTPFTLLLANGNANTRGGSGRGGHSSSHSSNRGGISAKSAAVTTSAAASAGEGSDSDMSDGDYGMAMATVRAAEAMPLYQSEAVTMAHARSAASTTAGSAGASYLLTTSSPDTVVASVFAPTARGGHGRAAPRGKAMGQQQTVSSGGASLEISYADDWFGCQQAVTLQVRPPSASTHWVPVASGSVRWR